MKYNGLWHVFYSGCMDNTPTVPYYEDEYYNSFEKKSVASIYARAVVRDIDEECAEDGYIGVEYGVCEVPREFIKPKKRDCDKCYLYSECDHQGAYQKDGKQCYEDSGGEKEKNKIPDEIKPLYYKHHFPDSKPAEPKNLCSTCGHNFIDESKACNTCNTLYVNWIPITEPRENDKSCSVVDQKIFHIDKIIEEWKQKIKDLQFSIEQFEDWKKELIKPEKKKGGCYQFTYCNECMAYPMGLGCPNIVKGPVCLKRD